MPSRAESTEQKTKSGSSEHVMPLLFLTILAVVWTWPLAIHFKDSIPGDPGDNYSFLWNLWWMRKAVSAPELDFFQSRYLFNPFGVDLINHPHTALQGYISATALASLPVIQAENLYIIVSVFLNAASAYALAFDIAGNRRLGLVAGVTFGGSPYIAAQLLGHFDLLTAWTLPLFALCFRRSLRTGSIGAAIACGACVAIAAYTAYYYVVYLALFAVAYTLAAWEVIRISCEPRPQSQRLFTARLIVIGLMAAVTCLIAVILISGGQVIQVMGLVISVTTLHNPLLLLWLLAAGWWLTRVRVKIQLKRPGGEAFWKGAQALMIATASFAVLCLPLIAQAVRLAVSGRYVSQTYFWRSAPRGVDLLAPALGNPFHPLYGGLVSRMYEGLGLDRVEAVGWIGVVPIFVLLMHRGVWRDSGEARRWKMVLAVFAIWALGPFLTVAGANVGLPLPQALARFVPLVDNARMPGRAIVCVYLALGVLMVLRLAAAPAFARPIVQWALVGMIAVDYLAAPIPLTALDRPAVYEQLATIRDEGAVIEVPFGIGDGLTAGRGSQDRRLLYHATIHGHPVVGGFIGRMPPAVAQAYGALPVIGNLLRLANGDDAMEDDRALALPFRYLVLDTVAAPPKMVEYVKSTLDMDLITRAGGKELYAVQGMKPGNVSAQWVR